MVHLLIQKLDGRLDPARESELNEWLADPANQELVYHYEKIWRLHDENPPINVDHQAAWKRIEATISTQETVPAKTKSHWKWVVFVLLLISVAFGVYRYWQHQHNGTPTTPVAEQLYIFENEKATPRRIGLSDGTKITLSSGASFQIPDKHFQLKRHVDFARGQAIFEVAHSTQHPFTVKVGNGMIKVLGTVFNIRHLPHEAFTEITLEQGKIAFSLGQEEVILKPGERLLFNRSLGTIHIEQDHNFNAVAWKTKELNFNDDPLHQVLKEAGRALGFDYVLTNEQLADCPLTGKFSIAGPAEFESVLQRIYNFKIETIGRSKRILRGGNCQ